MFDGDDQMASDEKLGRRAAETLLRSCSDEKGALMLKYYTTASQVLSQIMLIEIKVFFFLCI